MNFSVVVMQSLSSNKARSALLILTVSTAFLIYGVLGALMYSIFETETYSTSRLVVMNQAGMTQSLPINYRERIRFVEGVKHVGEVSWFGAFYQDRRKDILTFSVDPGIWIAQHPEMVISEEAIETFQSTRTGMLASKPLAEKYGWEVGDFVPLKSILFTPRDIDYWPFQLSGTFVSNSESGGQNYALVNYEYVNENLMYGFMKDAAQTFMVTSDNTMEIDELAERIDMQFSIDSARTSTTTDKQFQAEFFRQMGNLYFAIEMIMSVAFLSIAIVVTSTFALLLRQRTRDLGIMRVLGFSNIYIGFLFLFESSFVVFSGGILGLILAFICNSILSSLLPQYLPILGLHWTVLAEALFAMLTISVLITLLPVALALKMKTIDALKLERA